MRRTFAKANVSFSSRFMKRSFEVEAGGWKEVRQVDERMMVRGEYKGVGGGAGAAELRNCHCCPNLTIHTPIMS